MRNQMSRAAFIFVLSIFLTDVSCYKILFMAPIGTKSHRLAIDPVIKELARRGHQISFVSALDLQDSPNVTNIAIPELLLLLEKSGMNYFDGRMANMTFMGKLFEMFDKAVNATYKFPFLSDIMAKPLDSHGKPKFDLLVVDPSLNEFTLPLAQRMGIPAVYLDPGGLTGHHAWSLNIPHPYSYIPSLLGGAPVRMNFLNRFYNTGFNLVFMFMRNYFWLPRLDDVILSQYPEARPIRELESKVSLLLTNNHFGFRTPIPTMPYFIEVGGMHLTPAKDLPKDLEDFMRSSPEGVVYFSLGSTSHDLYMPEKMSNNLIAAFARLKQKVLFKGGMPQDKFSSNVRVVKWVPQNDLLGHPNLKLFITHGGSQSVLEAAYHGRPLLAFPLSADQHGNVAHAKEKGFAEVVNWKTFTLEEFNDKLNRLLSNKSYTENAAKVSRIIRDNPQHPKDLATYWIEYVIRHKGAPHLKSGAEHLNLFQYFLLDVIGAVLLAAVIVSVSLFLLLRAVYRSLVRKCHHTNKITKKTN